MDKITILKVLVGSYAHGLSTAESDQDFRSVYVTPTSQLLVLNAPPYKGTSWQEGETEDNTAYELAHFLHLATRSNPSILEVFKAPVISIPDIEWGGKYCEGGWKVKALFPFVWSSKGVYEAFRGYSHNQHKKMFDERVEFASRRFKYAVAYLRVLLAGIELLETGSFGVQITAPGWRDFLRKVKAGEVSVGEVVTAAEYLKEKLSVAYKNNPDKQTEITPLNEYLLEVRQKVW